MSAYLLIESRDPYESADTYHISELAVNLKQAGNEVAVLLINNGVIPARRDSHDSHLDNMIKNKINILADDFSLREHAIDQDSLKHGIESVAIDFIVDRMIAGAKVIWH